MHLSIREENHAQYISGNRKSDCLISRKHLPADWNDAAILLVSILTILEVVNIQAPTEAIAHSLFIQSGRHTVSEGKASPLFFCYGHHFPVDDAVRRKKLSFVQIISPGGNNTQIELRNERSLHSYLVKYDQPGTYALVAETNPGYFAMYIDKKGRKRHSLKPIPSFADKAAEITSSMSSSQWAKTYVFCKTPSVPFPARVNLPMELVPASDVSTLKPGDLIEMHIYCLR
jgi:uncharacterized GH25 family protein